MSTESRISPLTSYITDRLPDFYGGRQAEYLELAEKAIESGVSLLATQGQDKADPVALYHKVMRVFQETRTEIALRHHTKDAHLFGMRRDDPKTRKASYLTPYTDLVGQYAEYNKKYLERLVPILHRIPHDLKTFSKTSLEEQGIVLGKHYSFRIELLDSVELQKRNYMGLPTDENLQKVLGIKDKTIEEIVHDYDLMQRLKVECKDLYDQMVIGSIIEIINRKFPSPWMRGKVDEKKISRFEFKNIYVLTTLRLEIEKGKMACVGRHLTWMYQNWQEDPVERMRAHSVDYVIHQDPFLIQRTQDFCAKLFADILTWDRTKPLDDLKDRVALLRFTYAYSMPCERGDGAVGDWLELALYRHHGFVKTRHDPAQLPCFEPLSTIDPADYLKKYRNTVIVE